MNECNGYDYKCNDENKGFYINIVKFLKGIFYCRLVWKGIWCWCFLKFWYWRRYCKESCKDLNCKNDFFDVGVW